MNQLLKRGDIFWADMTSGRGEHAGARAVVVLSHEVFNERSGTAIVMPVTDEPQRAGFPLTLDIKCSRLPEHSRVKVSQIRALSTERLGRRLGRVEAEQLDMLIEGLLEIIGK